MNTHAHTNRQEQCVKVRVVRASLLTHLLHPQLLTLLHVCVCVCFDPGSVLSQTLKLHTVFLHTVQPNNIWVSLHPATLPIVQCGILLNGTPQERPYSCCQIFLFVIKGAAVWGTFSKSWKNTDYLLTLKFFPPF